MKTNLLQISILSILTPATFFGQAFTPGQVLQVSPAPTVKSPQIYEMERFGNVPIGMNTGNASYNINLFSFANLYNDKGLDINLNYSGTGFMPSKQSNYVGLDWSLGFGGSISREVRGIPDDASPDSPTINTNLYGYLEGVKSCNKTNNDIYNNNYSKLPRGNGDGGIGIKCGVSSYEIEPDKFNFNFMGNNGYFFIGNDMKPIIISENKNLKIDVSQLSSKQPLGNISGKTCFTKPTTIIITDEKGIKYSFGGNYENLEISYGLLGQQNNTNNFTITAWNLYKIEYPNSKVLEIKYRAVTQDITDRDFCTDRDNMANNTKEPFLLLFDQYHVNRLYINKSNYNYSTSSGNGILYDGTIYWGNGTSSASGMTQSFVATKKSLPNSIVLDGKEIVKFTFERFDKYQYSTIPSLKLKNISFYNYDGKIVKEVDLSYYRTKNYFFLDKVKMFRKNATSLDFSQEYGFDYYSKSQLPDENIGMTDYWGFYNGRPRPTPFPRFTVDRTTGAFYFPDNIWDANMDYCSTGLLKSVTYPTKGKSEFIYEQHKYSEKLDRNYSSQFRNVLVQSEGFVGGGRISKIINYSNDAIQTGIKEYKYISNYSPSGTSNISSGILSNYYRNYIYQREQSGLQTIENLQVYSDNLIETTMNSSPILYSEVTEIENGKGYTKYYFTDYKSHPDSPLFKTVDNDMGIANPGYFPENIGNINLPYRSNNYKRGKLYKQEVYDQNFVKLRTSNTEYIDITEATPNNFVTNVTDRLRSKYFFKLYGGLFTPSKEITDEILNNSIISSKTEYYYQSTNGVNLSKVSNTDTEGKILATSYQYADDKANQLMISKNMVGIPLETINTSTVGSTTKTLARTETIYPKTIPEIINNTSEFVLPLSVIAYDTQNNAPSTEAIYDKFDSKGNLQQYTTKDGVSTTIIWGYSNTLPIAKIEGAKLSDLTQSLIDSIVNPSKEDAQYGTDGSEQALIDALDLFRSNSIVSNFHITTYSYNPLIGVTSITPPSGLREIYKYDNSHRLEKILNRKQQIIKEFKSEYAPKTFFSEADSGIFYKNDCPSWKVGEQYTYKVPENKYYSIVNQLDANQKAKDEINANGQAAANLNASCMFVSCGFTPNYYVNMGYSSIQQTAPNHISVIMTFSANPPSGMSWTSGGISVGYIGAGCRPSSNKYINSGSFNVSIDTSGYVVVSSSGASGPPAGAPAGFSVEYDK